MDSNIPPTFPPAILGNIPAILGPWLVGGALSSSLLGIVLCQVGTYFTKHTIDSTLHRLAVISLSAICVVDFCALNYCQWYYLVGTVKNPLNINRPPSTQYILMAAPTFAGIVSQSFYVHRAYRLWDSRYWVIIVTAPAILLSFGAGIASIVIDSRLGRQFTGENSRTDSVAVERMIINMAIWSTTATNVLISAILVSKLYKDRQGFLSSRDDMFTRFLKVILTTALLPALVTLAEATILIAVKTTSNFDLAVFFQIPFVYALCALYTLNHRQMKRKPGPVYNPKQHSRTLSTNHRSEEEIELDNDSTVDSTDVISIRGYEQDDKMDGQVHDIGYHSSLSSVTEPV